MKFAVRYYRLSGLSWVVSATTWDNREDAQSAADRANARPSANAYVVRWSEHGWTRNL